MPKTELPIAQSPTARLVRGSLLGALFLVALLCLPQCKNDNKSSGSNPSKDPGPLKVSNPPKDPNPACSPLVASGFNEGDGATASTPFLICSYEQLKLISDDLSCAL